MNSNEQPLQTGEPNAVGGGAGLPSYNTCTSCGSHYARDEDYPKGFFKGTETSGCSTEYCYKCPNCGYERKV